MGHGLSSCMEHYSPCTKVGMGAITLDASKQDEKARDEALTMEVAKAGTTPDASLGYARLSISTIL
ncbi:hypothetical protein HaLaN_20105 [Haematococcus lacustris]|uniref:Uncharacterized protein n=1 Tax=Haematococcus lacustris TaxID=44745 RepID=A0A699ZK14_HAELA|nr:hypothetical protein HaLaN_20105 [Haematococcus lacustris]